MRRNATIEAIWRSGDFSGLNRADSRVTIDRYWQINDGIAPGTAMKPRRQPARWFQDYAASQIELSLPPQLIRNVHISRSLDSDAAQLTVTCWNADPDGSPNKPAQGWLSQRRGFSGPSGLRLTASGEALWPHLEPNEWSTVSTSDKAHSYGVVAQGNLVRTYQGYGGYYSVDGRVLLKPWQTALSDGNLVPTGMWIIDDVDYDDEGNVEISARDVGAILLDQNWYPPFVPLGCYPTQFYSKTWNTEIGDGPKGKVPTSTNYQDLSDIVRLAVLWAGFWLKGAANSSDGRWPAIFGGIEDTGIDSPSVVGADTFDKKPIIDPIKTIRDIVAYLVWIDQEGGFRFNSPNIWEAGNFDYDGVHSRFAWDIDEEAELTAIKVKGTKRIDRSKVMVAMADPYANQPGTVKLAAFDTFTSTTKNQLHGMAATAIMGLDRDVPLNEMVTLAELTGLRMWFLRRRATVRCAANPLIDIDDQIRPIERTTFNTYLHRVESIESDHDLDSGEYTMEMGTHWLGADNTDWVIRVGPGGHVVYNDHGATGSSQSRSRPGRISNALDRQTVAATVPPIWSP